MRNIKKRFDAMQGARPNVGSILNFNAAIKNTRLSRKTIAKWFIILVPKEECDGIPLREIIEYASKLAWPQDGAKKDKFRVRRKKKRKTDV